MSNLPSLFCSRSVSVTLAIAASFKKSTQCKAPTSAQPQFSLSFMHGQASGYRERKWGGLLCSSPLLPSTPALVSEGRRLSSGPAPHHIVVEPSSSGWGWGEQWTGHIECMLISLPWCSSTSAGLSLCCLPGEPLCPPRAWGHIF